MADGRHGHRNPAGVCRLLGLPSHLLDKVLSSLPLKDRFAFSAAYDKRKLAPYPNGRLLLYTGGGSVRGDEEEENLWNFLDSASGATYRCNFPGVSGARFHFSKEGWLFLSDSKNPSSLFLFNPLTGKKVVPSFIFFDFFTGRSVFAAAEEEDEVCGGVPGIHGTFHLTLTRVDFHLNRIRLLGASGSWDWMYDSARRSVADYQCYLAFWLERFYYLLFVPKEGDAAIRVYELDGNRREWIAMKGIGYRRFFLVKKGDLSEDPEMMEEVGKVISLPAPEETSNGDLFYSLQVEEFHGDTGSSVCRQGIWVEPK